MWGNRQPSKLEPSETLGLKAAASHCLPQHKPISSLFFDSFLPLPGVCCCFFDYQLLCLPSLAPGGAAASPGHLP